ncbi:M28 family peptidase [Brevibacillus migulae]|uniref:M28 family peptidase n=1 Tax=Brevibacillus migulae TaxID=1644114 RepID=UPI00106DE964|nr:M28 family peptidase [Brevibacillus migulae]
MALKKHAIPLCLVAALALGTTTSAFAAKQEDPTPIDQILTKAIKVDNIYNDIKYLSKKPRVSGTKEEDKAVKYIEKKFESFGLKTEVQPFEFEKYFGASEVSFTVGEEEIPSNALDYTANGNVTAELVYVGLGKAEDLEGVDLTGKIALIQRGDITFAEKLANAVEKGAEAAVIFNRQGAGDDDAPFGGTLGGAENGVAPIIGISYNAGMDLVEQLEAGESVTATVHVDGSEVRTVTSHNVIATKPAKSDAPETDQIVIIGAHHDSVEGAPGANDDASGTATTLELARVMAKMPTDTEIRFITFGAEEDGLVGSYEYVDSLSEDEQKSIVAMFQLDMVGSRDAGDLIMYTVDGNPNNVTKYGGDAAERLDYDVPYGQESRSDHVPFYEAGIPAALFIHSPSEPWYHSPEDTIDKISKEKLKQVASIVGAAAYNIAEPNTPALPMKAKVKAKSKKNVEIHRLHVDKPTK